MLALMPLHHRRGPLEDPDSGEMLNRPSPFGGIPKVWQMQVLLDDHRLHIEVHGTERDRKIQAALTMPEAEFLARVKDAKLLVRARLVVNRRHACFA